VDITGNLRKGITAAEVRVAPNLGTVVIDGDINAGSLIVEPGTQLVVHGDIVVSELYVAAGGGVSATGTIDVGEDNPTPGPVAVQAPATPEQEARAAAAYEFAMGVRESKWPI